MSSRSGRLSSALEARAGEGDPVRGRDRDRLDMRLSRRRGGVRDRLDDLEYRRFLFAGEGALLPRESDPLAADDVFLLAAFLSRPLDLLRFRRGGDRVRRRRPPDLLLARDLDRLRERESDRE